MRKDIRSLYISVPVPTDLYISMSDLLSNSNMICGPALSVPSVLEEYRKSALLSRDVSSVNDCSLNHAERLSPRAL